MKAEIHGFVWKMGEIGNNSTSLLGLLLIGMMQFCWYQVSSASCIKEEMESLLKLKASFVDPSSRLGSWKNGTNCCNWEGVGCNHTNGGHVVMLDLGNYNFTKSFSVGDHVPSPLVRYNDNFSLVSNGVHSSLFELKYLNHLDLSANNFNWTHIPNHFSSLLHLTYLNLSFTNFNGRIPPSLENLTKLLVLDLKDAMMFKSRDYFPSTELEWIYSLSSLEYLDLSNVNLSKSTLDFVQLLNTLPSLLSLKLSSCGLQNTHHNYAIPLNSSFLSKLEHLDLASNMFDGPIPNVLQNMTSLRYLYLSSNRFSSSIPLWLSNLKDLVDLELYDNNFSSIEGGLSSIVTNNCHVKSFRLSFSYFLHGDVFGSPKNLSVGYNSDMEMLDIESITSRPHTIPIWLGNLKSLKYLNLGNNSLYGLIPSSLGNLSGLEFFDISNNMLAGDIPVSFGKLSNLWELHLTKNKLDGVIPESLGQLQSLTFLEFAKNAFKCILSEVHFANLSQLDWLGMNENYLLSFGVKHDWVPPFQLIGLSMRSTMGFRTIEFPRWIGTQKKLTYLNLFNTNVVGPIPTWLRFQQLHFLDLSYNKITGSFPKRIDDQMPNLDSLFLSNTHINGSLPRTLCRLKILDILKVSNNRLSGIIPNCLLGQFLNILDLSSNNFVGIFPSSFHNFSSLEVINLANNQLEGEPLIGMRSLNNLRVLDLERNQFSGHIPPWVGKIFTSLQILNLRGNMFKGTIPSTLWLLPQLQILILADNKLVGNIQPNVGHFSPSMTSMESIDECSSTKDLFMTCYKNYIRQVVKSEYLNYSYLQLYSMVNVGLSNNNLDGPIPSGITTIKGLFSLNLSHNNLSGTIPVEIGTAISLESLDLSFNQLSGSIPNSLSSLSSLGALKLSNNNFSGLIPREGHLLTFNDASSFEGNPYLCGDPLFVKCPNENSDELPAETNNVDDDELEKMWFYIVITLGYALGFWGVVGGLILKRSWRHAYFQFMDETKGRIHVAIMMNMTRLKQRMR